MGKIRRRGVIGTNSDTKSTGAKIGGAASNAGGPVVELDLHGMLREEAVKAIDRALRNAGAGTYQIRLIHGYTRGTSLKNMILDEYRDHPKVRRVQPGDNQGITILVLRELFE